MADVDLTVRTSNRTTAVNWTDQKEAATAADTYFFVNNGRTFLTLAAATSANVTVETTTTVDGLDVDNLPIVLPDTDIKTYGPFPPGTYNDGDGKVKVTVDANCDLLAFTY